MKIIDMNCRVLSRQRRDFIVFNHTRNSLDRQFYIREINFLFTFDKIIVPSL